MKPPIETNLNMSRKNEMITNLTEQLAGNEKAMRAIKAHRRDLIKDSFNSRTQESKNQLSLKYKRFLRVFLNLAADWQGPVDGKSLVTVKEAERVITELGISQFAAKTLYNMYSNSKTQGGMTDSSWPRKAMALALALDEWECKQVEAGTILCPLDDEELNPFEFVLFSDSFRVGFLRSVLKQLSWTSNDGDLEYTTSSVCLSEIHVNGLFHLYGNKDDVGEEVSFIKEFSTPNCFIASEDQNDGNAWRCDSTRRRPEKKILQLFELKQCVYARDAIAQVSQTMGRYTQSLRAKSLPEGWEIQSIVVVINIPSNYVAEHPTHHRNFIKMCGDHGVKVLWWAPTSPQDVADYFDLFDKWASGSDDTHEIRQPIGVDAATNPTTKAAAGNGSKTKSPTAKQILAKQTPAGRTPTEQTPAAQQSGANSDRANSSIAESSKAPTATGVAIGAIVYVVFDKIDWFKAKITALDGNKATVVYDVGQTEEIITFPDSDVLLEPDYLALMAKDRDGGGGGGEDGDGDKGGDGDEDGVIVPL